MQDLTLFEAIMKRHSYRGAYQDIAIPRADLLKILQAGTVSPTAYNIQTTEFVVVDDPSLLKQISAWIDAENIRTAKALIVCMANDIPNPGNVSFTIQNLSVAVENMLLTITALGYASVWMDHPLLDPVITERITALLSIKKDRQLMVILPVGVPVSKGKQLPKRDVTEVAWFNKFGSPG